MADKQILIQAAATLAAGYASQPGVTPEKAIEFFEKALGEMPSIIEDRQDIRRANRAAKGAISTAEDLKQQSKKRGG